MQTLAWPTRWSPGEGAARMDELLSTHGPTLLHNFFTVHYLEGLGTPQVPTNLRLLVLTKHKASASSSVK